MPRRRAKNALRSQTQAPAHGADWYCPTGEARAACTRRRGAGPGRTRGSATARIRLPGTAPEGLPERPFHERRHAAAVTQLRCAREEGLQVILHDLVKYAAGGIAGFVARGRPGHPAHEAEAVPTSHPHAIRPTPVLAVVRSCCSGVV